MYHAHDGTDHLNGEQANPRTSKTTTKATEEEAGQDRPRTLTEKVGQLMLELAGFYLALTALNALWQLATG